METVLVIARYRINNNDARAQAAEVIRLLKRYHSDLVLADYSDAHLTASLANLYWLPDYYTELGAPQHARFALVLPRNRFNVEAYQFFQIACRNAGYNVKLFDEKVAAEAWLSRGSPRAQLSLC
jgi:hypothetical protein